MKLKNNLLCLLCLFIFSTCSGISKSRSLTFSNTAFFSTFPSESGLVFIGAAGKRSNPKETLQFALEDAAQRVAVFYHVSGEYAVENNIGSGAFDYSYNTNAHLFTDKEHSKQYVNALNYDADVCSVEIDNTFFIRAVYNSSLPYPVNFIPKYAGKNRKPDWVDNPPSEIDGYETGVGFSERYSSIHDTFTNSWYNAVFAIIRKINSSSRSNSELYHNTGSLFGYKTSSDNSIYSYGALNYFYALDTWIDPKTKSVWTLAIAGRAEK